MTVPITQALAALPNGEQGVPLSLGELAQYIKDTADRKQVDRVRESHHRLRDDLYRDGGVDFMRTVIDEVFENVTVRDRRKQWVPHARFVNPTKRVVNETSTVYSERADRKLSGAQQTKKYQELLDMVRFDEVMHQVNRMFNLHRSVLVGPRVRTLPDGERDLVVDVVTPASFRVVLHPTDSTLPLGYLIRFNSTAKRNSWKREAKWILWTAHERIHLDEDFLAVDGGYLEHGLGLCPWVPLQRLPNQPGFWPGAEGSDLIAAHVAIWMSHVLLLKEQKSATKQTLLQGEISDQMRGQAADSETPIDLPEGTAAQTVDMSMDLDMFSGVAQHIMEGVANDYGMSGAYIRHQGVQSAEARDLMRVPLRELRREQQPVFRLFEQRFVKVLARVLEIEWPEMAFDPDGWSIDFGEAQTPLTPIEGLQVLERRKAIGIDSVLAYIQRENPDIDANQARKYLEQIAEDEEWLAALRMPRQAMTGALQSLSPLVKTEPPAKDVRGEDPPPSDSNSEEQAA